MSALKVSVIMPVYNAERFLEQSIISILEQSLQEFEFIIIDDGSKDRSLEIIKKFKKKDKRIVLIENKKNLGLQKSLNKGLRLAKGKYVARMDADDISLSDRLKIQEGFLERNPSLFLVGGSAIVIDEEGKRLGVLMKFGGIRKLQKKLLKTNPIIHPSIMFRNFNDIYYRENFVCSEDYDLYLRLLSSKKKMINLSNFLIKYRISSGSFVSTRPHQDFYFKKAREFYTQRISLKKDDYDIMVPPKHTPKPILFEKVNLKTRILVKFQDHQMSYVRKEIKNYLKKYGYEKDLVLYYILSYLPRKGIHVLRELF